MPPSKFRIAVPVLTDACKSRMSHVCSLTSYCSDKPGAATPLRTMSSSPFWSTARPSETSESFDYDGDEHGRGQK